MSRLKLLVTTFLLFPMASALEMEILDDDIECDQDLPVRLNFTKLCHGGSKCTFGHDENFQGASES